MKTILRKSVFATIIGLLVTISAFAYSGGNGTEQEPYLISSKADMEELATKVNGGQTYAGVYFLLTRDLTEAEDVITTVIGEGTCYFSGVFDGGDHKVNVNINININNTYYGYAGVFGCVSDAIIKNLGVTGSITGAIAGSICGIGNGTTIITNCYNTGDVAASYFAGGICGRIVYCTATITDCYNTGDISATFDYDSNAGGICGGAYATITNCYNTGNVSSATTTSSSNAGGICGEAYATITITNCHNTGDISSSSSAAAAAYSYSYAGGICGYVYNGTSIITNCYNTGEISASAISYSSYSSYSFAGGICGEAYYITITNCYNIGDISSSAISSYSSYSYSSVGGICGYVYNGTITNCYNTGDISAASYSSDPFSNAGGICGWTVEGTIANCIAANTTITALKNSINNSTYAGRIVRYGGTVQNCYALAAMQINSATRSSQNANSKDGKDENIASFQLQSWIEENVEWDFDEIWEMSIINSIFQGFPIFKNQTDLGITSIETPKLEEKRDIVVYPNPAKDYFSIQSDKPVEKIEIYNSSGFCVLSKNTGCDKVDVSAWAAGFYFVRIYVDGASWVRKVLVE